MPYADEFFSPTKSKFGDKSFPGHAGIPGHVGGSAPRGGGGGTPLSGGGGENTGPRSAAEETLNRTPKQRKADIRELAKKPTAKLRKEQTLIEKQIQMAFNQRNDKALAALQQRLDDYTQAIMMREFR